MRAKSVLAIQGVLALPAVMFLSHLCGCAAKPAPQPARDIVKESDEATARETAEKQKEWAETMEKLRSMWKGLGVEVKPDEVPDPTSFFGLDWFKEKAPAALKGITEIVVTEQDSRALDAYAAGQFTQVEELLKDAAHAPEKRPFPLFLRGCALFELKRFADAASCFDEALSLEKESRMSCLLAEMSRRLEKSPDATDEDIWTAYDFAYKATMDRMPMPKEDGEFASLASAFDSPMTLDPINVRLDQMAARIREKRRLGILQDYLKATDLDQQIVLTRLMDAKIGRPAIISLSKEHLENKELQVFAFLGRYYCVQDDKLSERGPDYAQEFATAQADEPENGCLVLLGIDDTLDKEKVPLSAAEIDLLKRAVHSKEFDTYFDFGYPGLDVAKESRARGGECFGSREGWRPIATSAIRHIVYRASATIVKLFEDGKEAEAQALLLDVKLLIAKFSSEHSDSASRLLSANHMMEWVNRHIEAYAVGAKRADLIEKTLPEREAAVRWEAVASAGAKGSFALLELPVRRIREADSSDSPAFCENQGLRMLRLYPDRFRDEAIDDLGIIIKYESAEPNALQYNAVVILQMLKDPKALPTLEPLVKHADPLISRLAQEAIADIKNRP